MMILNRRVAFGGTVAMAIVLSVASLAYACVYYVGSMTVCGNVNNPGHTDSTKCGTSTGSTDALAPSGAVGVYTSTTTPYTQISALGGSVTVAGANLRPLTTYTVRFQEAATYPLVYCVFDGIQIGTATTGAADAAGYGSFAATHMLTLASNPAVGSNAGVGEVCMSEAGASTGNAVPVTVVGGVGDAG